MTCQRELQLPLAIDCYDRGVLKAVMVAVAVMAGCADHGAETVAFAYHATAGWSSMETPSVVALTIDGQTIAENAKYTFDATFASYSDALTAFVAKPVTLTTTVGTFDFTLDIGACEEPQDRLPEPLTSESDQFFVEPAAFDNAPTFTIDCFSCVSPDTAVYPCS